MGSGVTPVMRISWQKGSTLWQEMCDISEHKDGRSSVGTVQTKGVANILGGIHTDRVRRERRARNKAEVVKHSTGEA